MHIPLMPYISLYSDAYNGVLYTSGNRDFRESDLQLISKKLSTGLTNNTKWHAFKRQNNNQK